MPKIKENVMNNEAIINRVDVDKITPTTKIVFHYTDRRGNKQSLQTIYRHARDVVIELLELTTLDEASDVYYTLGNITKKLDYYNTLV